MADEVEELFEEEKPKNNNMALIAIVVVVLLSNGIWGAVYFMSGPSANAQAAESAEGKAEAESEEESKAVDPGELGPIHTIEPFVVNLNEPGGSRFLRIGVSLEMGDEKHREVVESRMVPLKDVLISELSSLDVEQISSKRDKERLREDLLESVQGVTSRAAVRQIYFTEFMVQ
jgi:flagellar FliL protein